MPRRGIALTKPICTGFLNEWIKFKFIPTRRGNIKKNIFGELAERQFDRCPCPLRAETAKGGSGNRSPLARHDSYPLAVNTGTGFAFPCARRVAVA